MIQVWVGAINDMVSMSKTLAEKYCEQYGITYHFIHKKNKTYLNPTWEKLLVWDDAYQNYDNVMILDSDIMISPRSPNLFDYYQFDSILGSPRTTKRIFEAGMQVPHKHTITGGNIIYKREFLDKTKHLIESVVKRAKLKHIFKRIIKKNIIMHSEEPIIQKIALRGGFKTYITTHLHWNWGVDRHRGYIPQEAYFIHYHGDSKKLFSYREWEKVLKQW